MQSADALERPSLKISEVFASLQGEGPSLGTPCLFVRLALCNLRCRYCDTSYTWDFEAYDYATEVQRKDVDELVTLINQDSSRRLVLTGGEPLLQQRPLASLVSKLDPSIFIEVETNGTIAPSPPLLSRVDQWNVSPKLANSGEPLARRIRSEALSVLLGSNNAWLKLVVATEADFQEAEELVEQLGWPRKRVLFMPLSKTREELKARSPEVAAAAERRQFGFSSRLHLELWDGKRGT